MRSLQNHPRIRSLSLRENSLSESFTYISTYCPVSLKILDLTDNEFCSTHFLNIISKSNLNTVKISNLHYIQDDVVKQLYLNTNIIDLGCQTHLRYNLKNENTRIIDDVLSR